MTYIEVKNIYEKYTSDDIYWKDGEQLCPFYDFKDFYGTEEYYKYKKLYDIENRNKKIKKINENIKSR